MPKKVHYVKDSQLFTKVIQDFASLTTREVHKERLGCAGGHLWFLNYQQRLVEGIPYFKVSISCDRIHDGLSCEMVLGIRIGPGPLKNHITFQNRYNYTPGTTIGPLEDRIPLEMALKFVRNKTLKIQVEIRVDVIFDKDGIRHFNFCDPFEGCVKLDSYHGVFYVRKQFVSHHSSFFEKDEKGGIWIPNYCSRDVLLIFLQVFHGVPVRINPSQIAELTETAQFFQAYHVLRFCELLLTDYNIRNKMEARVPTKYEVKRLETRKALRKFLKGKYLGNWKTELLKTIVKKFFSFAADNNNSDKITVSE